ncbi:MAG: hypothetical protein UIJ88_07670 [Anaerovoracaceae bacterium]|nr:hypothetical protein [Anaerovoracaceae bacterium]
MNFPRAGVCCFFLKHVGIANEDAFRPYLGAVLGTFLTIAYVRRVLDR